MKKRFSEGADAFALQQTETGVPVVECKVGEASGANVGTYVSPGVGIIEGAAWASLLEALVESLQTLRLAWKKGR